MENRKYSTPPLIKALWLIANKLSNNSGQNQLIFIIDACTYLPC